MFFSLFCLCLHFSGLFRSSLHTLHILPEQSQLSLNNNYNIYSDDPKYINRARTLWLNSKIPKNIHHFIQLNYSNLDWLFCPRLCFYSNLYVINKATLLYAANHEGRESLTSLIIIYYCAGHHKQQHVWQISCYISFKKLCDGHTYWLLLSHLPPLINHQVPWILKLEVFTSSYEHYLKLLSQYFSSRFLHLPPPHWSPCFLNSSTIFPSLTW